MNLNPLFRCLAAATIAVGLGGCQPRASCEAACRAPAAQAPQAAWAATATAAEAAFRRRALNVLLLPLLDDDEPPRWASAPAAAKCDSVARISVDGQPLVPGAAVPARAFRLVWSGSSCGALGDDIVEIAGTVTLTVFHDGDAYSAVVEPEGLRVVTGGVVLVLNQRFSAVTPLAPPAPEPELPELEWVARRAN